MPKTILQYGRQKIEEEDIRAVVAALKSDFLTNGPTIAQFERAVADYVGAKYAIAVANGTAALHLAVLALGINKGAKGITSPNTFMASANAMVYCGLVPKFADIDPHTYNLDPAAIERKISSDTKLVIPVHFAGQPCDMKRVAKLAKKYKLFVIEDAAHAIGSEYKNGSKVGNCRYSDMTIFSFHPVKTITTGEGGMITTNNKTLYERLIELRSHGIVRNPEKFTIDSPGPWYHEMQSLGFNYRMTDIQAALGISQLKRLPQFIKRRRMIVKRYNREFNRHSWIKIPVEIKGVMSAFHLYVVQIDFNQLGMTRSKVMKYLESQGIGSQVHYIPVHLQPFYKMQYGYRAGDFPIAEAYYNQCLSLPLYPGLTDDDVQRVISCINGLA